MQSPQNPETQSFNYAFKTRPTVTYVHVSTCIYIYKPQWEDIHGSCEATFATDVSRVIHKTFRSNVACPTTRCVKKEWIISRVILEKNSAIVYM